MKKQSKVAISLEKFMTAYYTRHGLISSQILSDLMEMENTPAYDELFSLLSQDKKKVIETLQNSLAINQVFFKMKNDFVDDLLKQLRDLNHLQEEEKLAQEKFDQKAIKSVEKTKQINQLVLDLGLSDKQKQILKNILEV